MARPVANPPRGAAASATRWVPYLLVAAVVIAFARVVPCDFSAMDDASTISFNARLNPPSVESLAWYWTHPEGELYIPVTYTAWTLLAKVCWVPTADEHGLHLDPHIFHAASLVLHVLSTLAVYHLLRRLLAAGPSYAWPAAAGALLFALHSLQVEAVAWTSGMKDLLYGLFSLTALLLYVTAVRADPEQNPQRRLAYWLGAGCLLLGLLSKPTAMVTPVLAAILDRMILGRRWRQVARALWPWALIVLPLALVAKRVQSGAGIDSGAIWQRPAVMGGSLAFYLAKLFVPIRFAFDYGWRPPQLLHHAWFWWFALPPVAISLALWAGRRRRPWLAAAGLVSVVALLPVLGLVPFSFQYFTTVADHYTYVAMLGPAMVLAWALTRVPARWLRAAATGTVAVLVALAADTAHQLGYWHDVETCVRRVLQVTPDSPLGHNGLAREYQQRNDPRAEEEFKQALDVYPHFVVPWQNLANLYQAQGRTDDAIRAVNALVEIYRALPPPYRDEDKSAQLLEWGVTTAQEHRFVESARYLEAYLTHHPDNADARQLLEKVRDAVRRTATRPATTTGATP
jgi:tetratricopeptide (TPR) repeat protein